MLLISRLPGPNVYVGFLGNWAGVTGNQVRSFGDILREHRVAAGLTQEVLAERARMSRAAIAKLERGERQRPYRATIALLADALSLTPDDRLELERAAQRGAQAMLPAEDVRAAVNLPVHLSSFVGRDQELARVGKMLATHRLVTLVGAGGVGKTRLAVRAAEQFISANATEDQLGSLWFVDLSAETDAQMTMAAVASSVGMQRCRTLDALIEYLRSQKFLLLLDNCEHLIDEVAHLAGELLRHCANGQILATSRQALGLDGERVYRVPPLSAPAADTDAELSPRDALEFGAIRLFADRAEAADSRFELTKSIVPSVAEICRRLDGIALAIELAAARTNAFPAATIARRLDEHFLLFTGRTHTLSRHKTMRTVFDWSYNLLDEHERGVFRRLSVFVGGFSLELAMSLWAGEPEEQEIVEIIASLADKSLVQCDPYAEPPRYKMLEPARQYAREKLREQDEQDAAARAHARALLALAEGFDSQPELPPDRIWDAYIERERDNFRAAFEWALGPHGDAELGQRLAGSSAAVWCGIGSGEVRRWIRAALESCSETTPPKVLAKLANIEARTAIAYERDEDAKLAASRRALSLQQADDLAGVAHAQFLIGTALANMGRHDEADDVLRQALATARSSGTNKLYFSATRALGQSRYIANDLDEARALISEALQQSQAAGSDRHAADAVTLLAEIEFKTGNVEQAVQLAEDAAEYFRAHRNSLRLGMTLCNLSAYLVVLSRYEEAAYHARESLRYLRAVGRYDDLRWTLQHLAAIAVLSERGANAASLRRAANILGFLDESIKQTGDRFYTEQQEYDKMIFALRTALGEGELAKLMADGKEWSEDQAIAEASAI